MQKIKFLILICLSSILAKAADEGEPLGLQKISGLGEYETKRFLADWGEVHPDKALYFVTTDYLPPSGPTYIEVVFNCMWDGRKSRYTASKLRIPKGSSTYKGELFSENSEKIEEVHFIYSKGGLIWLNPSITQEEIRSIKVVLQKMTEVDFEGTKIPFSLIQPLITKIYSPDKELYFMQLGKAATYSYESYHLILREDENGSTLELRHRTDLPMP